MDGREFWTLFLFDILKELMSEKNDQELWIHLE